MRLLMLLVWMSSPRGRTPEATEPEIICSSKPAEAVVSEDVVLRCHLEPPQDATDLTVEWSHGHLNHCVHLYRDREEKRFEGRTALSREGLTRGNLSLELSSVRLNDTGRYRCSFTAARLHKSCYVNLTVGEAAVIGSHEPVKVGVGDDAILPCHLEPPFDVTTLTVEWKYNNSLVHLYRSRGDNPDSQDEKFRDRTSLFHDELSKGNISLKLTNVTERDAGNYTCLVPRMQSQVKKDNVTLVVEPVDKSNTGNQTTNRTTEPDDLSGDAGSNIWAISGVVVVVVVVVAAAFAGWMIYRKISLCPGRCRRRRNGPNGGDNQGDRPNAMGLNNRADMVDNQGDRPNAMGLNNRADMVDNQGDRPNAMGLNNRADMVDNQGNISEVDRLNRENLND